MHVRSLTANLQSSLATTAIPRDLLDAFPTRQMLLNVDDGTHSAAVDVELIDSFPGRVLDQSRDHIYSPTAREIEASMKNEILANRQNEAYHRMARGLQQQTKAAQKVRETNEIIQYSKAVATQIAGLKETRCQALAQEMELREQLKTAKVSAGGILMKRGRNTNASRSVIVSASSTGRVKSVPAITASTPAIPPIDDLDDSLLPQPDIAPPPEPAPPDAVSTSNTHHSGEHFTGSGKTALYVPNYLGAGDLSGFFVAETAAHLVPYPDMSMFSGSDPTTLDELLNFNSSLLGASIDGPSGSFGNRFGGGDNIQNQLRALRAAPSPSESGLPAHPAPTPIRRKQCRDQVDESNIISSIRVRTRSAKLQQSEKSEVDPTRKKRSKK
ncbi:hypothetical protein K438DRAFT_2129950 [Mycena galopus ATCC 62051]|nr:hypothetical protein K438DRAFT_2129950 [Mycena galopus ATCC 62051]